MKRLLGTLHGSFAMHVWGMVCATHALAAAGAAPQSYGRVPSNRQMAWHEMKFYGMIHFGLNTYRDR